MRRLTLALPLALLAVAPALAQTAYEKQTTYEQEKTETRIEARAVERQELLTSAAARREYLAGVAEAERPAAAIELANRLRPQLEPLPSADRIELRPVAGGPGEGLPEGYAEVAELYLTAARIGTPREAAYAHNEIANLYLAAGKPEHAVAVFKRLDLSAVPERQRFVYRFNRARALEQVGEGQRAWGDYLDVLTDRPAFRPAVEGAWRTLAAAPADDAGAAVRAERLARLLLDEGQHGALAKVLWPALERWKSPGLFAVLADWWSAAPPGDGGALPEADALRLKRLRTPLATELIETFQTSSFERAAQASQEGDPRRLWFIARNRYPTWREAGRGPALSALLTRLAGEDHRRGDQGAAFARTFVAWWLDNANLQAAADCATLLAERPGLDPEGELLAELVDVSVAEKLRSLAAGDWRNALRMHLLLAGIYEERGIWGSSRELHSAIFQLEEALRDERRLREEDPGYEGSPGLHRRLGEAYAAVGDEERACEQFAEAARALSARARVEEAARMRQRCP